VATKAIAELTSHLKNKTVRILADFQMLLFMNREMELYSTVITHNHFGV
jgi:hypothetical protein